MRACTYCGKSNDDAATCCSGCGTGFSVVPMPKAAARLPDPVIIDPRSISAAFVFEDGFHRVDWDFVHRWIESYVEPTSFEEAWNEVVILWLGKLRDDLGGDYFLIQTRQTILLCDQPLEIAQWVQDYAGRASITIKEYLGDAARKGVFGKDVILIFSDEDDYYLYHSYYTPDGEQATSGGVCIDSGYTHIALPWRDELDAASAIIHELTHDYLAHLPLPLWLNEGIAVTLQKAIEPPTRRSAPIMWDELADRHHAFWTEENIQAFWAGTSFSTPGDSTELSYSLAEVFLNLLTERIDSATFRAFVVSAQYDDAGQTAAMDILHIDLGEAASKFLGLGNWRPRRKAMVECWETAGRTRNREAAYPPEE